MICLTEANIKNEGIHRVTEGFSSKSREKELTGEKTPVRGILGVKRQNGHHSGRLTPGVQHPGRSEKRPVIKKFWRLTPARAPGWALNAHNG